MTFAIDMKELRARASERVATVATVATAATPLPNPVDKSGSKFARVATIAVSSEDDATAAVPAQPANFCHFPTWSDAESGAFASRRARLLKWGYEEPEADALAERLTLRDREADDRVMCLECKHARPGRCSNHQRAALGSPDLGRDLASRLQRCPGFNAADF